MSISAITFASAKAPKTTLDLKEQKRIRHIENPFKMTDIMPITVGLGAGLMLAYALKSGKLEPVKKFVRMA